MSSCWPVRAQNPHKSRQNHVPSLSTCAPNSPFPPRLPSACGKVCGMVLCGFLWIWGSDRASKIWNDLERKQVGILQKEINWKSEFVPGGLWPLRLLFLVKCFHNPPAFSLTINSICFRMEVFISGSSVTSSLSVLTPHLGFTGI